MKTKPNTIIRTINTLVSAAALLALCAECANAQSAQQAPPTAGSGFSFAVYGDSRSMMYLPYKADQEAEARDLMVDMFELVLPEKVAAEVVKKDVKLIYDPATHELVEMVMPFMTHSEVSYLTIDKGWVTEAAVEDVKLLPGVRRTMFRLQGGDWVAREMVKDVKSGRAKFILSTGDLVWWGKQGGKPSDNPYWKLVNEDVVVVLLGGRALPVLIRRVAFGNLDVSPTGKDWILFRAAAAEQQVLHTVHLVKLGRVHVPVENNDVEILCVRGNRLVGILVFRDGAHAGAGEGRIVEGNEYLAGTRSLGLIQPHL